MRPHSRTLHNSARMGNAVTKQRQRHTPSEVAGKLALADDMAAQGRLHGDIAKSLGISVMTYHRWRKARMPVQPAVMPVAVMERTDPLLEREQMNQIRELRLENLRLRRLVTDLLLEKDKLEEGLRMVTAYRRPVHG
jgi:putative transposase